jgi:hypothetical protein
MTLDAMDRLAAVRPDLDPSPDADRRSRDLRAAMAQPYEPRRRRPVGRLAIGVAAVAAAVVGGAVVLDDGRPPVAVSPVVLDARTVLLTAARRADAQQDGTGAFWHTVTLSRTYLRAPGYSIIDQGRDESWTPSAAGGQQWSRSQSLGAVPATAADRTAWERAGSPRSITVSLPGASARKQLIVPMVPGRVVTSHVPLVDGNKVFWLGRNVTMKEIRSLPTTPGGLKAWLLRSYAGHDTETASEPMTSDAWLFQVTVGLITDMPVTTRVRAAAFRMLADLPSVTALGQVQDAQGRTGIAITVATSGATRQRLIIDSSGGRALADETFTASGAALSSRLILTAGWTDVRP